VRRLIGELEKKVSMLKHATISIHDEVQADNKMLSGMVSRKRQLRCILAAGHHHGFDSGDFCLFNPVFLFLFAVN
jgi:hypothetical protein